MKLNIIRKIILSSVALIILAWAFFQNELWAKVIIVPFLVCTFSMLGQNIFLLLNKKKSSNIFKYIFLISFFVYVFAFLIYMVYYSIVYKSYSILIPATIFFVFAIYFIKKIFFNKNNKL